jgi:hypothetical protein
MKATYSDSSSANVEDMYTKTLADLPNSAQLLLSDMYKNLEQSRYILLKDYAQRP